MVLGLAVVVGVRLGLAVRRGPRDAEVHRIGRALDGPPEVRRHVDALEQELREKLPGAVRIDRLDRRPDQVVVHGRAPDLDRIADALERVPELELRYLARQKGKGAVEYRFAMYLGAPPPEPPRRSRAPSPAPLTLPSLEVPPPSPAEPPWMATVPIDDLEVLGVYTASFGPVALARSLRRDVDGVLRVGDQLNDGEVGWIGFFSPRLAAVRLKRWVWPPDGGRPYREVLRVVGWDCIPGPEDSRAAVSLDELRVVGQEALGRWPEGRRYASSSELLVEHVEGGRPEVDLFAALFYELHGILPWQHESWRRVGWTVEEGFPLHGSIVELAADEPSRRRDPFRSLLAPWSLQAPFVRAAGRRAVLASLSIDDLELEVVYATAGGPVAEVRSHGWFRPWDLRPGDQLRDGDVVTVRPCCEVVFRQVVDDPAALKPFRERVMRIERR